MGSEAEGPEGNFPHCIGWAPRKGRSEVQGKTLLEDQEGKAGLP